MFLAGFEQEPVGAIGQLRLDGIRWRRLGHASQRLVARCVRGPMAEFWPEDMISTKKREEEGGGDNKSSELVGRM